MIMENFPKQLAWICVFAAAATLIPWSSPRVCMLGYRAICPFTPVSTLIAVFGALIFFLKSKKDQIIAEQIKKQD